jgi:hypothetical protein
VIGYIVRCLCSNATGSLGLYILQGVFLLIPPIFFAATIYMVYSRVVRAVHGESMSLISTRWTTRIFVAGDFFCLGIQGDGAGLLGKIQTTQIGNEIIVVGLGLQILLFALFIFCCATFHLRCRASGPTTDVPWEATLNLLYAVSAAILLRNICECLSQPGD